MVRSPVASRTRILSAAETLFARYGFKRTSMEDIAVEAGLSRAALYLQFRNKEDLFRELALDLHDEAITQAEAALAEHAPLARRLQRAVEAKTMRMVEVTHSSPHGSELMDENNRLCGALATENHVRFVEMLAQAILEADAAGEVNLAAAGMTALETAELFTNAAAGLKRDDISPEAYAQRLERFVQVFVSGLKA